MTILQKIQSLLSAANTKTGESDATLTDAVQTLIDGYGQGGGGVLKVTSITLTAELNSYNILQAMGAKLYYQNSIVSMYVIGDTAAVGGAAYTNNNYTMIHHGTTVLKSNTRYSYLDQCPSKIAPSNIYIGAEINASRYVASDAFVNADGSFSFRRTAATVLTPVGATCVLIETPLLDSTGNFDITPFSA